VLCGVLLLLGAYWVLRLGFDRDILDRSGWYTAKDGSVQYRDYYGKPLTGWQQVDQDMYYFDVDGTMSTGWLELDGVRYYLDPDGAMHRGWLEQDGTRYCFSQEGALLTGWQNMGDSRYYFYPDGTVATGFFEADDLCSYADETGAVGTGWQALDDGRIYLAESGALLTGWQELDGERYYFDPEGTVHTGWLVLSEQRYYFTEEGVLLTGWQDVDGERYYFAPDGAAAVGWTDIGVHRYYFTETGAMYLGWLEQPDGKYYLKENGIMAIGQITLSEVNHFFDARGKYVLLVNAQNPVPADYPYDFVEYGGRKVDRSCYEALAAMVRDGRNAGSPCSITEIYRTTDVQWYLWNRRKAAYMEEGYDAYTANLLTGQSVAIPGHSEHHTGLAVDFNRQEANTLRWIKQHCWEYGFILRYPEGKYDQTGIAYEPWHYRYVGIELAAELKESGLCLEEYMQMLTRQEAEKAQ